MQLPIKAHYAVLAMLALAMRHRSGQLLAARTIAAQQGIPSQFLGQLLQQLRMAGLIQSTRGSSGGFRLALDPDKISLMQVLQAVGFNPSGVHSPLPINHEDPLAPVVQNIWQELFTIQSEFLEGHTVAELVQRVSRDPAGMFYI
jgi:Rrf2 family iron-sulfur cluster assembly transcriptional regulator